MEEIELKDLYYMIINKLWLIVLLAVLAGTAGWAVSHYYLTPEYSTSTTLMLGKPTDYDGNDSYSYQDVLVNQRLIGTYAEIAKSKVVLSEVKDNLGTQLSTGAIGAKVRVNLVGETEIIRITVKDTNPERATQIANVTAEVFMKNVSNIMHIDNVQIIDVAEEPVYPIGPNVRRNTAIAGVLGAMVALFIIFVIQMFDNTVKIPEDIQRHLGLPVIGMIPDHD